jgi:hypothetical protein
VIKLLFYAAYSIIHEKYPGCKLLWMVNEWRTPQSKGDSRGDRGLGVFVQGTGPEELLRTIAQVYAWPALPARKKPRSLPVENTSVTIHVMENTQNISEQQGKSGFTNVDKAAVPEEHIHQHRSSTSICTGCSGSVRKP